jgi:NADPH-dependent curcumin reductase CurA
MGGGGAVGLAAIYIAKAAGCYVACTCGKRSMEKVTEAGAERAVDYASPVSHNNFLDCLLRGSNSHLCHFRHGCLSFSQKVRI